MAGHLLFNSGSNESSLAPQFKWLDNTFNCLRPFPLLGFCLGWCSNFVGSESGHIHNVKLLQNMVSNRTPIHLPPPPPYTLYTYIQYTYSHREGGRGGELNQKEG
jgi:hypothetical protein